MDQFPWFSNEGYQTLIESIQDGIFVIEEGRIVFANQALLSMSGYSRDKVIGFPFDNLVAPQDKEKVQIRYRARMEGKNVPSQYELHLQTASGDVICCSIHVTLIKDKSGNDISIGSMRDITQIKEEIVALESSKTELQTIFDQLPDVFYRTDMQGIITLISPACYDAIGYYPDEMVGLPMADFYYSPEDRQRVVQAIADGNGIATQVEAAMRNKQGQQIWVSTNARVRLDENGTPGCVEGVARNITARKNLELQLLQLTRTDSLTGVCNRHYFFERSEDVLNLMRRYQHPASLMMADLDHFKEINDKFGHQAGDIALQAFTQVCRDSVRESDFIGRLGGEEFALMLPETSLAQAQQLAERIRHATETLSIPFEGRNISITVSIGLVEISPDNEDLDQLIRHADMAMYRAKELGRNHVSTQ